MLRLAVIGMGLRASFMVKAMLDARQDVTISAVVDPDRAYALKMLTDAGCDAANVRFYDDIDERHALASEFDGLLIGTRCHLHASIAIRFASTRLPIFLEKPVAITRPQWDALAMAYGGNYDRVMVSFPLRVSPLLSAVREIIQSGRLGTINQVQAVNYVSYGGIYFGNWYRNYDEAGGLWMQKATHDFDYLCHMLGRTPHSVFATDTQAVYGGDQPFNLKCSQCDRTETCMESPLNILRRGDDGGMDKADHWCAFSEGIRNQDAGSAILMFDDDLHVSYVQNFLSRRSAGRRGAVVTGYRATLEFDWCTDLVTVRDHHADRVDQIKIRPNGHHSGGDHVLAEAFIALMRGETGVTYGNLHEGLRSAAICLAARESANTRTLQPVPRLTEIVKSCGQAP